MFNIACRQALALVAVYAISHKMTFSTAPALIRSGFQNNNIFYGQFYSTTAKTLLLIFKVRIVI